LDVEHITAHEKGVGAFFLAPARQLAEEMQVLVAPVVVLVKDLADVQVGSVQYLHGHGFVEGKDNDFRG